MALIDKASLLMVPSTYEAGKLYNVLPSGNRAPDSTDQNSGYDQTRADFDFDRGSNAAATRVNASGLIEKYRENLLLQSNQFDTTWTNVNSTETSGQSGYDGSSNAWVLALTGGTATKLITQSTSTLSGVYNTSFYAKAGTHSIVQIGTSTQSNIFVCFDLSDGSVGSLSSNAIDAKATSIANGWYRIEVTFLATNATGISIAGVDSISATRFQSTSSTGNFYIQDAQLEKSLVATAVLTSGATTAKAGVLVDLPRINYDANGENGALLLEPSRANLLPYSEYLSTFGGTATINDNAIISPEGLQNAAEIVLSASGTDSFYKEVAVSANTKYTLSFYVKQGSNTNNQLAVRDQTNSTFIATDVSYTASSTEWKRIEYTFTTPAGCVEARIYPHRSSSNSEGNGYFYGIQVEAGSYVSSYIPTMGTSETRAADSCSVTGASDVIGQTEGTLYWELEKIVDGFDYYQVSDGGTNNWILVGIDSGNVLAYIKTGGAVQVSTGSPMSVGRHKIALAYAANDVVLYLDGVQVGSDTSVSIPATNEIALSQGNPAGAKGISTKTFQCALFNERLSNAELATLTTL